MAGFDLGRFETEQLKQREKAVPVAELAAFFGNGSPPEWRIRGLSGIEVALVHDSARRSKDLDGIIKGLASNVSSEKTDAIKAAFGISPDATPDDYVKRLTMLELGSIEPKIRRDHAVKVAEFNALVFYRLTDEIMLLTGMGKQSESSASGTSPESGQVSPSAPGADSEGAGSGSSTN